MLAAINVGGLNYAAAISADARELFFTRLPRIGPEARPRIFRAARSDPSQPFGRPQRVAAADGFCEAPTLSADGRRLYFHRLVDGRFRIFESER